MWQDGNLLQIQKLLYKLCGVLSWSIRCSSLNTERRLWWYILNVYYNVLAIPTCTTFFLRHRSLYGFTIAREEYTIKLMVLLATTGLLLSLVSHNSQVRKKWTHVSIAVTIFANCFWLNLGIIFKNWLAVWTLTFFFFAHIMRYLSIRNLSFTICFKIKCNITHRVSAIIFHYFPDIWDICPACYSHSSTRFCSIVVEISFLCTYCLIICLIRPITFP